MRSGVWPRPTRSAIRVPSTTRPRPAPSAKIASGSLIHVRNAALPCPTVGLLGGAQGSCQPRAQARPPHIGGSTPFVPTATKPAASAPSSLRWAGTKTVAPGLRSAAVAGPKVTIGVPSGIEIVFSPPLYESLRVRPSTPLTALVTVALVIVLFGFRSHG